MWGSFIFASIFIRLLVALINTLLSEAPLAYILPSVFHKCEICNTVALLVSLLLAMQSPSPAFLWCLLTQILA